MFHLAFIDMWEGHWQSGVTHRIVSGLRAKVSELKADDDWRNADVVIAGPQQFGNLKHNVAPKRLCVYTGENTRPNPHAACNAGFDFRPDDPSYYRVPLWWLCDHDIRPGVPEGFFEREALITTMVGNPNCEVRNSVMKAFGGDLLSGGPHLNNIGGQWPGTKKEFMARGRFGLAYENASYPGYCTEKIVQARDAGCIPVYSGDPKVLTDINHSAIVQWHWGWNPALVVEGVKNLDGEQGIVASCLEAPFFTPGAVDRIAETFDRWMERLVEMANH